MATPIEHQRTDSIVLSTGSCDFNSPADPGLMDSRYATVRLLATMALVILGNSAIYVLAVMQPEVQREFGISAADASLPYTLMMISLGIGGILCGRWADRYGVARVLSWGAVGSFGGFVIAGLSPNMMVFALAHGLLLGLLAIGSSFVPLIADTALWWSKRRGLAVAICMSGNAIAGMVWPPIIRWGVVQIGWRQTYIALALICGLGIALLCRRLRQRPPLVTAVDGRSKLAYLVGGRSLGRSMSAAQWFLFAATISACAAMAIPQGHLVAYGIALGFDASRGAAMLSIMLVFKSVGRLASGWISDQIGGVRTLLLGLILQAIALASFLPFDSVTSLYLISALFGLIQGGIVPACVIIVREHFSVEQMGARVGLVMLGVQAGLALGGWVSARAVDLTGFHQAAFLSGLGWGLLSIVLISAMLVRLREGGRA